MASCFKHTHIHAHARAKKLQLQIMFSISDSRGGLRPLKMSMHKLLLYTIFTWPSFLQVFFCCSRCTTTHPTSTVEKRIRRSFFWLSATNTEHTHTRKIRTPCCTCKRRSRLTRCDYTVAPAKFAVLKRVRTRVPLTATAHRIIGIGRPARKLAQSLVAGVITGLCMHI